MSEDSSLPSDIEYTDLEPGDVLRDRRRKTCFEVTTLEAVGVGLRHDSTKFYVPHALFAPWYDTRIHQIEDATSSDPPDWTRKD